MEVTELLQYMAYGTPVCIEFKGDDGVVHSLHGTAEELRKHISSTYTAFFVVTICQSTDRRLKAHETVITEIVITAKAVKQRWGSFDEEMDLCDLIAKLK